jgi:NTE family protein
MTVQIPPSSRKIKKTSTSKRRLPFECIALVLQGGGALGSYQAGVYEAFAEVDLYPDWVAGISIGAINAAIIAGNPPKERVAKLRGFWETITANPGLHWTTMFENLPLGTNLGRSLFNKMSANFTLMNGAPDFFTPRTPFPFLYPEGTIEATSFYDTNTLKNTLERFVDFDRINHEETRFSVGAVNVRTGNFIYFDNRCHKIRPEHVMASGSLPPGFAATEIDGEFYWDGGLISNTPLDWVVDRQNRQDTLAFQIDLWNAEGSIPGNLADTMTRQKEIQYSSRTRASTDRFKYVQRVRCALANLLSKLPSEFQHDEDVELLKKVADHKVFNIVQLIYRAKKYEGYSKDYEFSRWSMKDHWQAGYKDAVIALQHPEIFKRPDNIEGVATFDCSKEPNQ